MASWQSACLEFTKPWVPFPSPYILRVTHTCNFNTLRRQGQDDKTSVILSSGYSVNLSAVWDEWDPERMKGRKQEKEGERERGKWGGRNRERKKGEGRLDKERRKTGSKTGRRED